MYVYAWNNTYPYSGLGYVAAVVVCVDIPGSFKHRADRIGDIFKGEIVKKSVLRVPNERTKLFRVVSPVFFISR